MAQPTGTIQPSDFGYRIGAYGTDEYMYVIWQPQIMPRHWRDDPPLKLSLLRTRPQISTAAGTTFYVREHLYGGTMAGSPSQSDDYVDGGGISAAWQSDQTSNSPCEGNSIPGFPLPDSEGDAPRHVVGYLKLDKDDAGQVDLWSLQIKEWNDQAYATPSPSGARAVERQERTTAGDRMYKAYRSASAWDLMWGACHTYNRLSFYNANAFCVPFFGHH